MICRGICVLVPGVEGLSENIEVISVIDRFLEHSRVFVFANNGHPLYFTSSADWMVRNLDHRFEVVCPIEDKELQKELYDMLQIQLNDNCKARWVNKADDPEPNTYRKAAEEEAPLRSQLVIYDYFKRKSNVCQSRCICASNKHSMHFE